MPAHEGAGRGHTTPLRNCSSTCSAAPRCHPLRATPGIGSSKETCPGWRPLATSPHSGQSNPLVMSCSLPWASAAMWKTSITALKGHAQLVGDGRTPLPDCGQCIGALTLSLEALRNPNPPFANDIPALSIISCVLGMSNSWRKQFHTEVSCALAKASDHDGWTTRNK